MKKNILSFLLIFVSSFLFSQTTFTGMIMDKNNPTNALGVEGASVNWFNTNVSAITNKKGWFTIAYKPEYKKLVVSYVGFKTDTLTIISLETLHHFLTPESDLDEITIKSKKNNVQKSLFTTTNVFTVNSAELLKAACCNLAESFETNPSIDVGFSDALTGTRQIKMLGLTSPYLLITQENIPSVRGASQVFGLTFTPGTWVESIQITKGAGSVVNGFESIAGQINTEIKDFADLDPALELALAADPVPPSVAANDESSVEKDALFQLSEQEDGVNSNDSSMIEEYSGTDMGDHQDSAAADE